MAKISFLIILLYVLSSCSSETDTSQQQTPEQVNANKEIVHRFYKEVLGGLDEEVAHELLAEDYIQHNPMVKTGKAGFFETLAFLKQMPRPENPKNPIVRTIAEGDFVVLHLSVEIAGSEKVVVDLFRIEDGKLAEHWDAIEDHPAQTVSGHTMTDGVASIDENANTSANKKVVSSYYEALWVNSRPSDLSTFVATDLIQHSPEIDNGLEGLSSYLQSGALAGVIVHRIIGEGDFVVAQLEGQLDGKPYVFYEIHRLSDGRIVEQWGVKQEIPDTMLHENGMI